jgi:CelD/BcsL family acetyltransferase involved in cellulose biosynthesis
MEIREFSDLTDPGLLSAWTALEEAGACPSLFASHTWVRVWMREFAAGLTPSVFVGYGGSGPIGLAPLYVTEVGAIGLPVNFLSLRGEFLISGEPDSFVSAVLSRLRARGRALSLRSVPVDSPTHRGLSRQSRGAGYYRSERRSRVSARIDIKTSWQEYIESFPGTRRRRWEKQNRRLRQAGEVRVGHLDDSTDVDALVDRFIDVESRSWKENEGTSIRGRGLTDFYHELCRALAGRGWLQPWWLELDGQMIAFMLGAVFQGTYWALKSSYDEEYARFSPGICLSYEVVRGAFEGALERVDLPGERAKWKCEWATGEQAHATVALYPRGPAGAVRHLTESWARPLVRKVVRR